MLSIHQFLSLDCSKLKCDVATPTFLRMKKKIRCSLNETCISRFCFLRIKILISFFFSVITDRISSKVNPKQYT